MQIDTLRSAIEKLEKDKYKGTHCACCGRYVKVYKRRMYHTPTRYLIALYHLAQNKGESFFHVTDVMKQIPSEEAIRMKNDSHKASYFGLLEEQPNENNSSKRTSGFWRITPKGKLFVEGKLEIPKYAFVYNSEVIGFSEEQQSVKEALGANFDYHEIMSINL